VQHGAVALSAAGHYYTRAGPPPPYCCPYLCPYCTLPLLTTATAAGGGLPDGAPAPRTLALGARDPPERRAARRLQQLLGLLACAGARCQEAAVQNGPQELRGHGGAVGDGAGGCSARPATARQPCDRATPVRRARGRGYRMGRSLKREYRMGCGGGRGRTGADPAGRRRRRGAARGGRPRAKSQRAGCPPPPRWRPGCPGPCPPARAWGGTARTARGTRGRAPTPRRHPPATRRAAPPPTQPRARASAARRLVGLRGGPSDRLGRACGQSVRTKRANKALLRAGGGGVSYLEGVATDARPGVAPGDAVRRRARVVKKVHAGPVQSA
jgi:hypothetical protein